MFEGRCNTRSPFAAVGAAGLLIALSLALALPAGAQRRAATHAGVVITTFGPTSGPPGTQVTISGSGFTGTTSVLFNQLNASFIENGDGQITATVPSGAATGFIEVNATAGKGTSSTAFCSNGNVEITAPSSFCSNSPGTASVPFASGATYTWTVTGGTLITGQGTNTISFTAGASGNVQLDVSTTIQGCPLTNSITRPITASPDATITAPSSVCVSSTGNTASVPVTTGATYVWTITGGTITAGATTNQVTFSAGTADSVVLNVTVSTPGCGPQASSKTIATRPYTRIVASTELCPTGNTAQVVDAAGAPAPTGTFNWTVTGGTITAGQGTNTITFNAPGPNKVTIAVNSSDGCGSNAASVTRDTPSTINAPAFVCPNQSFVASVPFVSGLTYLWTSPDATINGSATNSTVNVTAGASGNATLNLAIGGTMCSSPYTANPSVTVPIKNSTTISAPNYVCASSGGISATTPSYAGANYFWFISNGTITSGQGTDSITFSAGTSGSVGLSVTTSVAGCSIFANRQVMIGADTTFSFSPNVCINSGGHTASVPSQAGATYNWVLSGGTITGGQGTNQITYSVTTSPTVVFDLTVTNECGTTKSFGFNATKPNVNISAQGLACASSTGNVASVPAGASSYSWTSTPGGLIQGATNTNSITYNAPASGTVTLTVQATDACGTNTSSFVVNTDGAAISAPPSTCANGTIFASVPFVNGATILWTATNGTIIGSATGNSVQVQAGSSGTLQLNVSVTGTPCGNFNGSKNITITGTTAGATITAPVAVCPNTTGNTASVTPVSGATYTWSLSSGTITAGQGTDSITFTAPAAGANSIQISVLINACDAVFLSKRTGVGANAVITPAAEHICINSTGNTASVPLQAGATYSWTIFGGTITAGQATNQITYTAGTGANVFLTATVTAACGTATESRMVETNPPVNIFTSFPVCPSSTGNTASVISQAGYTYNWTVTNGTITAGQGTNQITYTAGASGDVTIGITSSGSCGTNSNSVIVPTNAANTIVTSTAICAANQTNINAFARFISGATYTWTVTNGTLVSGQGTTSIVFNAGATGNVDLGLSIGNIACPASFTKSIPINALPASVAIAAPAFVCANSTGNNASIAAIPNPTSYTWTITNGTITAGQGTTSITFTAGATGFVSLNVTAVNSCGSRGSGVSVPIDANTTITAPSTICVNSTGNTASVPLVSGSTYAWSVLNGTITGGQTSNQVTFTAGPGGNLTLTVAVTTSCTTRTASTIRTLTPNPAISIGGGNICANATGLTASVLAQSGATYLWTISNGTITAGQGTNAITFNAGASGELFLTAAVTNCGTTLTGTTSRIINPPPDPFFGTTSMICSGATATATADDDSATSFLWTVTNGTITAGQGTDQITYQAAASGVVGIRLVVTGACGGSAGFETAIPISAPPASSVSAASATCANSTGNTATATQVPTGATVSWSITNGTITAGATSNTVTFTAGASGEVTLTATVTACGIPRTVRAAVPIDPIPAVTISPGRGTVCANSISTATASGPLGSAAFSWSITNGTIVGGATSRTVTYTAGPSGDVGLSVTVTQCGQSTTTSATVPVATIDVLSILPNAYHMCPGAPNGASLLMGNVERARILPPDATVTWSITNGTITSQGGPEVYFTAGSIGFLTLTANVTSCSLTRSHTLTLPVSGPPVVRMGVNGAVCASSTGNQARVTVPNATSFAWSIVNGTITSSPNTAAIVYTAGASGSVELTAAVTACGTTTSFRSVVPINDLNGLAIGGTSGVCPNTSRNAASVASVPGATYAWSITNGTITSATSNPSILYTAGSSGVVGLSVTVTACSGSRTITKTVPINAAPAATINVEPGANGVDPDLSGFCPNARYIVSTTGSISGAKYQWSITNATILDNPGDPALFFQVGSSGNVTIALTITSCGGTQTTSTTIPIASAADATITAPANVCANATGQTASVPSQAGATYTWTIGNGTITAGQGTSQITYTAGGGGSVSLAVTVTAGCSSANGTKTVAIVFPPSAAINAPNPPICANATGLIASVPSHPTASYVWTLTGGTITAGQGTNQITFTAGASGTLTIGVTATGCGSPVSGSVSRTIFVADPTITGAGAVCSGAKGATAAAANIPGATYTWTITNGTITSGQSTNQITYDAGTSGSVTLGLTLTTSCGTASSSREVTINAAPATITAPDGVCASSAGNRAFTGAVAAGTYTWSIGNGTITDGQGTPAITFTAGATGSVALSVVVADGVCRRTGEASVQILSSPPLVIRAPQAVCPNAQFTIDAGEGFASYRWSTGEQTRTITRAQQASTTYSVIVTSASGCSTTGSVSVGMLAVPAVSITGPDTLVAGDAGTASVSPVTGASYDWSQSNGVSFTGPTNTASVSFTTLFAGTATLRVAISTGEGCIGRATKAISVTAPVCATAAPVLGLPADGATTVASPVTFTWSEVANTFEYVLKVIDSTGGTRTVTTKVASATLALGSGKYAWSVAARSASPACPQQLSGQRQFTIPQANNCATLAAPQALSPVSPPDVASPISFNWTGVAQAIGYRVWVSVNGAPPQDIGSVTAPTTTLTTAVPPGANKWYVDAVFAGCPSRSSNVLNFRVPAPDPCAASAAVQLSEPANNATLETSEVTLRWLAATGATGYRVKARLGTGAFQVVGLTKDVELRIKVESGRIEWFVESFFDGCPAAKESERRTFEIPAAVNCGTAVATLQLPPLNSTVTNASVTFVWGAVPEATAYELLLALGDGQPQLVATTPGTTLNHTVPPGRVRWVVRATFNRCPARDSQIGVFQFVPPPTCPQNRPVPVVPLEPYATTTGQNVQFRWGPATGATSYRVTFGDTETATVTTTEVNHVYKSTGTFVWKVEALYPQGCAPLSSSERTIVVNEPPPPCTTPPTPSMIAPGEVSSGVEFTIRWSTSGPGITYLVEEWAAADRSDLQQFELSTDSLTRTRANLGSTPINYQYRVRALPTCGTASPSAFSTPLVVTILPTLVSDGSIASTTPLETPGTITYQIPLGPELALNTFEAVPSQPWITVAPRTGTVPIGGTTLTVTVNTAGLSVGTSVGFVSLTLTTPGDPSGTRTHGGTVVTTPVSVSLVTPVQVSTKTAPPPDALIIPGVAHADGLGTRFESDVALSNTSAQVQKYQITFTPTGESGVQETKQTTIEVSAGQTVALDDVLQTFFGSTGAFGTLEIRPITTSSSVSGAVSSLLKQVAPTLSTFASSRTFAVADEGTFGQYIPAIPFADFVGKTDSAGKATFLSLQQIAQSADYRTNIGLVEGSGNPAQLQLSIFNSSGAKLKDLSVSLAGGQHSQLNSLLASEGIQVTDGRVEVRVLSTTGSVTAYASVLDNKTNDPMLVTPMTVSETGSNKWVVPGVADLNTGQAHWLTDVRIFNAGSSNVVGTLTFYSQGGGDPKSAAITLTPGEVKQLNSILAGTFGVTNDGGALHITTLATANLVVTARTYDQTDNGTFGQFIQGITPAEALGVGGTPLQILQVEQSERYRSNIGVAEVNGKTAKVEVSVVPADSRVTAIIELDLAANEYRQLNSLLSSLGLEESHNVRVSVKVLSGEGKITAFASVVDQTTQDPTFVPGQ